MEPASKRPARDVEVSEAPNDPESEGRSAPDHSSRAGQPLVRRAIDRSLSDRYASAADEVSRLIDATYRVLERSGSVDPRVREILAEAGLSTQAFYRHFASKDELLLVVLDDGLHQLTDHLRRRMDKVAPGIPQVRAWIEGVLAQAVDPEAASRTRPFVNNVFGIMSQFPEETERSINMLLELLNTALHDAHAAGELERPPSEHDARAVYHSAFGPMEEHVARGTQPTPGEIAAIVDYACRGLGCSTLGER